MRRVARNLIEHFSAGMNGFVLRLRLLGTLALEDADGRTVLANSKPGLLLAF